MRRKINLGDPREEQKIIQELMTRYRQIMASIRQQDRATARASANEADQILKEMQRRMDRLPAGLVKEHLMRKMYE